jgi:hypothetical protein
MINRLFAVFLGMVSFVCFAQQPSVAFFYGDRPPMNELRAFDWVVVEPGHLPDPSVYQHDESQVFAYVSLGEVSPDKPYLAQMSATWLKGENRTWNSRVIDQTSAGWASFAVEQIFAPLWQAGYRGFFLDTLDSFNLIANTDDERAAQAQGLANVIAAVKQRFPQAKLIFNRGFEVLPLTHQWADAVAFESWLSAYDADKQRYRDVPQVDRDWLAGQLAQVQLWNIPVIAIDYVAPEQRVRAREIARQIQNDGFIPWVTNPELNIMGVGSVEVMPRRVLMVTKPVVDEYDYQSAPDIVRTTSILNAMGYAVDYAPVNRPLPNYPLIGRYAGVVVALQDEADASSNKDFSSWLVKLKQEQVPLLLLGNVSYLRNSQLSRVFGLQIGPVTIAKSIDVDVQTAQIGFERQPDKERFGFFSLTTNHPIQTWLSYKADSTNKQIAVGMTAWGGFALTSGLVSSSQTEAGYDYWVVNPYSLFEHGLQLQPMPLPDTTTESGRRLLTVHNDGNGFAARAEMQGTPFSSKVILDTIVKKYPLPMSMSVIEGEVSAFGVHAKDSRALEKIARDMFAQPNVEIASHSYSHPFNWGVTAGDRNEVNQYQAYNLLIPNYRPSIKREIEGSIDYINHHLAPKNKKVMMFNWSGDFNPSKEALGLADALNVVSVNGGETKATLSHNTLTKIGPVGLNKDGVFQVFSPHQNESAYTNYWTGPFYGYERVLETYQLTESPRRIKPVGVYFNTYLASKPEGLASLKKVLNWTMLQSLHPVFMSDYARKAKDFNQIVVSRSTDNRWEVRGLDNLKELRLPQEMGYPELVSSSNISGFNDEQGMRYLHAVGNNISFSLTDSEPKVPYLISANAAVTRFERTTSGFKLQLSGQVPLSFSLNASNCQVNSHEKLNSSTSDSSVHRQFSSRYATSSIEALCRP